MSEKKPVDQQIVDYLKEKGTATVDEIAAAVKIGRTSARKYLAGLKVEKKIVREPGDRDGGRKLPDTFSLPEKARGGKPRKAASSRSKNGRLGPGELDNLVLDYMREHKVGADQTLLGRGGELPGALGEAGEGAAGEAEAALLRVSGGSGEMTHRPAGLRTSAIVDAYLQQWSRWGTGVSPLTRRLGDRVPDHRPPFPESIPPGLNHLVVTGTLTGEPRRTEGPQGDVVVLFPMAFPVRDPERPQQLWTWASCEVEAPEPLAEQSLPDLQVGAPVLAGGQLGARHGADGDQCALIVAAIVHPGDPPSDSQSGLLIPGDG